MRCLRRLKRYLPEGVYLAAQSLFILIVKSPPVRAFNSWRLRRLVAIQGTKPVCLHLGCGARYLNGWINIDIMLGDPVPDVLLDLQRGIPLPDGTVDYIYSEDFIEHLDFAKGCYLLSECSRVLRVGGAMRIVTPNLLTFALAYINRSETDLAQYRERFGCSTFAEMFNTGMRAWGHKFLYDEETLVKVLTRFGFDARKRSYNYSEEPILRGLDLRNSAEGSHSMYFDCYKLPETESRGSKNRFEPKNG
jgi:predicted SAM-dependent methyltransferase